MAKSPQAKIHGVVQMYIVHPQGVRLRWHMEWANRVVSSCQGDIHHPFILLGWGTWVKDRNGNAICCLWEELEELKDD